VLANLAGSDDLLLQLARAYNMILRQHVLRRKGEQCN